MSNEVTKKKATAIDGFEGYEDAAEGTQERGGQVIQGQRLKFTNEATWETDDGEEIDENREFIAVDVARIVQRWGMIRSQRKRSSLLRIKNSPMWRSLMPTCRGRNGSRVLTAIHADHGKPSTSSTCGPNDHGSVYVSNRNDRRRHRGARPHGQGQMDAAVSRPEVFAVCAPARRVHAYKVRRSAAPALRGEALGPLRR